MGTHIAPVNRAGSNASDTSVALAFSWAVSAGSGANPVNAADFPGGTFPSGTGTIPAGSASATITFQSNPDTTFEQDETGILTLTTTQNGVTITGSPQPFTITNDDADPGSGSNVIYGPTSTTDTGPINGGTTGYRLETTLYDTAYVIDILGDANTNLPTYRLKSAGSDGNRLTGFFVASDGSETVYQLQENMVIDYTGPGVPLVIDVTSDGAIRITINGKVVKGRFQSSDYDKPRGTINAPWLQMRTGSTTNRLVTVTKA